MARTSPSDDPKVASYIENQKKYHTKKVIADTVRLVKQHAKDHTESLTGDKTQVAAIKASVKTVVDATVASVKALDSTPTVAAA